MSPAKRNKGARTARRTPRTENLQIEIEHRTEGEGRLVEVVALILQWIREDAALQGAEPVLDDPAQAVYNRGAR
jgi:hypothetical protein